MCGYFSILNAKNVFLKQDFQYLIRNKRNLIYLIHIFFIFASNENDMKTGLVLEGGGMRGLFTTGIIDTFLDEGITVDGMIGVSAGACFGCNFKSRQRGRALRYNILLKDDPKYMGLRCMIKTGEFIGSEYAYHYVPKYIDYFNRESFKANPMEFTVVCTDIETGEPVYKKIEEVSDYTLDWIRASASLPLVSKPVCLDGYKLLDGGMSDAIPLKYWQSQGYEKNIVVLTQPREFRKKRTGMIPLFNLLMRKYPNVIEAMKHRHEMYNDELDYILVQEKLGNTLLIFPPYRLDIGRIEQDKTKMIKVRQLGIDTAQAMMKEIKDFLSK